MTLARNARPQLRKMFFSNPMNPSDQTFEAQYNPAELQEQIGANYARLAPRGLGHQVLQFSSTNNVGYSFDLYFNASDAEVGDNNTASQVIKNIEARNFLLSLCVPVRGGTLRSGIAPPRTLFVWPSLISMVVVVLNINTNFARFAKTGHPIEFTMSMAIEEIRDSAIFSDQVRAIGMLR